ncbi:MAG: FtsW/RodA/SpoVE family cell cycle protein [Clostridiales bacterium]|nr:FtsW/RodA/SpoVE family cell cycle protein [Clostridiales bacterium]
MADTGVTQLKRDGYLSAIDYWLLVPVLAITLIGLYVLNQVLSTGFEDYPQNLYKQIGAVLIGIVLALVLGRIELPSLRLVGYIIYGSSVLLLALVLVDGFSMESTWGADSWLKLPVLGTFQPSELTKIGLAMVSANLFEAIGQKRIGRWTGAALMGALYLVPVGLIMMQPDFGTTMVIVFMFVCMLFVFGISWRVVLLGVSSAVIAIPLAWIFYFGDYQKNRILTFLYPGHDPDASYNLLQAKAAIASGGLAGNMGGDPVHVPIKWSDFIYTAVSEHMGFIGTTALLILIFYFLTRSLYIAAQINPHRPAAAYMVVGLTASLAFHYIENLGMCVGLLPITGIPLPFVSLGGTSMVVNFIGLGVMLNISIERNLIRR